MTQTFEKSDYLCIGPYCWGRAATAREAYRIARANFPFPKPTTKRDLKKWIFSVYRLPDSIDRVEVMDNGTFTYDSDTDHPVKVLRVAMEFPIRNVPVQIDPSVGNLTVVEF